MIKTKFLKRLDETMIECSKANWDGYNAEPANKKSCTYIKEFINQLPDEISMPDECPEPNGKIGLEWKNNKYHLALTISKDGKLDYTAIIPDDVKMQVPYDFKKEGIKSELITLLHNF